MRGAGWLACVAATAACGRIGFEGGATITPDGAGAGGDTASGSGNAVTSDGAGGVTFVDCPQETVLAIYSGNSSAQMAGSFSDATLELAVGTARIGDLGWLRAGFAGITDFRFADDPDFGSVAAVLTDTAADTFTLGFRFMPDGIGGAGGHADVSLAGVAITTIRRDVQSLAIAPARNNTATEIMAVVEWSVLGCR